MAIVGRDLSRVHSTLALVCRQLNLEGPKALEVISASLAEEAEDGEAAPCEPASPGAPAPIDAYLGGTDISPSGQEVHVRGYKPDLIGKGVVSVEEAEALVKLYFEYLDPVMFGLVGAHKNLQGLRDASPALLAAVCTVAAMHHLDYSGLYEQCYREYRHLVSTSVFENLDTEHIRGLVVGSYWLPGASRILLCEAVRRAGDVRLHRAVFKALAAPRQKAPADNLAEDPVVQEPRDRVRLWYTMFMCDQHQSTLNNRDGLLPLDAEILQRRAEYAGSMGKTTHDLRLVSQCSLLLIMNRIKRSFGSETLDPLPVSHTASILAFMNEIEGWITAFEAKISTFYPPLFLACPLTWPEPPPETEPFHKQAMPLHYSFARLYLGHFVFRGLCGAPLPTEFITVGRMAYDAAVTIYYLIRSFGVLDGLWKTPAYLHIMISFAGHLLMEVCLNYREQLKVQVEREYQLLESVVMSIYELRLNPQHPLKRIGAGLRRKLLEFAAAYGRKRLEGQPAQRMMPAVLSDMVLSDFNDSAFQGVVNGEAF